MKMVGVIYIEKAFSHQNKDKIIRKPLLTDQDALLESLCTERSTCGVLKIKIPVCYLQEESAAGKKNSPFCFFI